VRPVKASGTASVSRSAGQVKGAYRAI